jgi:aminopeptidase YwaD
MRVLGLHLLAIILICAASLAHSSSSSAVSPVKGSPSRRVRAAEICPRCIRAYEDFLASDALNGRGSTTHDELVAATYVASKLEEFGIAPAGDNGGYLQKVALIRRKFSISPQLRFADPVTREDIGWKHGLEMLLLHTGPSELSGPLQKIVLGVSTAAVQKGGFVLLMSKPGVPVPTPSQAAKIWHQGAVAVLIPENPGYGAYWQKLGEKVFAGKIELPDASGKSALDQSTLIMLNQDAVKKLGALADGTMLTLNAPIEKTESLTTWNVLGRLEGSSPTLAKQSVLLSAHYDHLGMGEPGNGDSIYNGADDDASGVAAVLELARVLGLGRRPRRPVFFALFGSEELGGLGSEYFRDHSPVPLDQIAANLEFEMIGRPDPKIAGNAMFLSGWERSNFGPVLAQHGAHLVADPHPEQNFFERSDNFELAKRGVVAQTISSFGLHEDYHQPSDDVAHLDFKHMDDAIQSLLAPVEWLVNSSFKPEWKQGGRP